MEHINYKKETELYEVFRKYADKRRAEEAGA